MTRKKDFICYYSRKCYRFWSKSSSPASLYTASASSNLDLLHHVRFPGLFSAEERAEKRPGNEVGGVGFSCGFSMISSLASMSSLLFLSLHINGVIFIHALISFTSFQISPRVNKGTLFLPFCMSQPECDSLVKTNGTSVLLPHIFSEKGDQHQKGNEDLETIYKPQYLFGVDLNTTLKYIVFFLF